MITTYLWDSIFIISESTKFAKHYPGFPRIFWRVEREGKKGRQGSMVDIVGQGFRHCLLPLSSTEIGCISPTFLNLTVSHEKMFSLFHKMR